jgi:hypothetical protein
MCLQGAVKHMEHALQTFPDPVVGLPEPELSGERKSKPEIPVIITTFESTQAAFKSAVVLAMRLGARVTIVAVQAVPFPLPLDGPRVPLGFLIRRLGEVISRHAVETQVRIYLCRNQLKALERVLIPRCPVVLGISNKRWWSRENRLARGLRHAGHEVILVETE